jgi:hypothetical protein
VVITLFFAEAALRIGEVAHDTGAALDVLVEPLEYVGQFECIWCWRLLASVSGGSLARIWYIVARQRPCGLSARSLPPSSS